MGYGVKIEGNKLGLGVNLFSEEKTLIEKLGYEYMQEELAKKSLSVADLDIVSSSVALRFLCRAELLNKNYDYDKVVDFLKISLKSKDKAERQAKLLLSQKGDI